MATLMKYFCCCKSLHQGVLVVGQVMPIASVGLLFYTFTLDNSMEICKFGLVQFNRRGETNTL